MGNKCTIADIAHWGWITISTWSGVEINDFPHLKAWEERMARRPAVLKGKNVPDPHPKEKMQDKEYQEQAAKKAREWIMADQKK